MVDVTRNPPCSPNCPGRGIGCHADCEKYLEWKKALEAETLRRRAAKEAAQNVNGLAQERKEWLRRKGYKNTGGQR